MKTFIINRTNIWGIALLTAFAGAPLITAPAVAAPDPNPPAYGRSDRNTGRSPKIDRNRNSKDNRYDSYRTYNGTVVSVSRNDELNARINGRTYRVYSTSSTRDLRVGDAISIYGQMDRGVSIRNARITYRNDNRRGFNTYTGEVTAVKGDHEFDALINGRSYDIYSDKSSPRVRRGDIVRIYGKRVGNNDIRESRVTVTRSNSRYNDRDRYNDRERERRDKEYYEKNRYNNSAYGPYRSYSGVVTRVRDSREFDVRIDRRIYNVYSTFTTRGISVGDEVRVYGRRFGSNDIRKANVRITRNR